MRRYLHFQRNTHCNFIAHHIIVDCEWNVSIDDRRNSVSPNEPPIPTPNHPNTHSSPLIWTDRVRTRAGVPEATCDLKLLAVEDKRPTLPVCLLLAVSRESATFGFGSTNPSLVRSEQRQTSQLYEFAKRVKDREETNDALPAMEHSTPSRSVYQTTVSRSFPVAFGDLRGLLSVFFIARFGRGKS
jgi:hypothetical protein